MNIQAVQGSQQAEQATAVSKKDVDQKQATPQSVLPQDTVTISPQAQAKQASSAKSADPDHDGK
jgi:hypothetical protein